jgi:membrane fusion protein, copper/silver efflux system
MSRGFRSVRRSWLVVFALCLVIALSCAKRESEPLQYHCPMHPTYISDRPGDCPICGMRLVPIETRTAPQQPQIYQCPMHPEVTSDKPGRCPLCGMELVPVKREEGAPSPPSGRPAEGEPRSEQETPPGLSPVKLDKEAEVLAGIRTETAERRSMQYEIRTVGIVLPDETRIRHIHTKISGWVEQLFVSFTGQLVKKGDRVLTIYSPELLASQEEFLKARELAGRFSKSAIPEVREGGKDLVESARRRLELFDVPAGFMDELERTGVVRRSVPLMSPDSGFVTVKSTFEGQQVEPGMELFSVTDLSQVWIEADFYEYESRSVKPGQEATILFPYDPGRSFKGRVSYIYPYLNPESRTLRVRFDVPNPGFGLKPSMYVDVLLAVTVPESVLVPDSAVMDSGIRQIVFVSKGEGLFEPREVRVGLRTEGVAQILSGLTEGEKVAVGANFLLDSESRLRSAVGAARETHVHSQEGGQP